MAPLPLEGIRVCDFGWVLVAPQATAYMGIMGADIIKIESRVYPCVTRRGGPYAEDKVGLNRAATFNAINYGKRSVALNLNEPEAVEMVKEIVKVSDIVLENFIPGTMERRGLAYQDLVKVKPDIIMLSASMLGQTGPLRQYMGWGPDLHSFSGVTYLTQHRKGGRPSAVGGVYPDYPLASFFAFSVLAALHHRNRTGQGQYIDWSMNEAIMGMLPEAIMDYTMNGRGRGPIENRDELMAPSGCYRCQGEDAWVTIACRNEEEWQAMVRVMGNPEWAKDEKFADMKSRWQNHDELDERVTEWTRKYTPVGAQVMLQKAGVPAGASLNTEEFCRNPHLWARGFFVEVDNSEIGNYIYGGANFNLSAATPRYNPTPCLGEHSYEVLHELFDTSEEEFNRLVEKKVIY